MNGLKPNLSFDPKDDYEKAKKDIFQAINSIQKLSPQQRERLAIELFGIERIELIRQVSTLFLSR